MATKKNLTSQQHNKLNARRKKLRGYALYTGAILAKLPAALAAIGWAPYASEQGAKIEHWIQNNITKLIPTDVDDKIIQFADKVEDKYVRPMIRKAVDYSVKVIENTNRTSKYRQDINDANTYLKQIKTNANKLSHNNGFRGGREDTNEQRQQKFIRQFINKQTDRPEILKELQPSWQEQSEKQKEIWGFP